MTRPVPIDGTVEPVVVTRYMWAWSVEGWSEALSCGYAYATPSEAREYDPRVTRPRLAADETMIVRARLLAIDVPVEELLTLDEEAGTL